MLDIWNCVWVWFYRLTSKTFHLSTNVKVFHHFGHLFQDFATFALFAWVNRSKYHENLIPEKKKKLWRYETEMGNLRKWWCYSLVCTIAVGLPEQHTFHCLFRLYSACVRTNFHFNMTWLGKYERRKKMYWRCVTLIYNNNNRCQSIQ